LWFLPGILVHGQNELKITPNDPAINDYFAWDVAIWGDVAVLGTPNDDDYGNNSGSVYIFNRFGTNWVQTQKIAAGNATASDQFGYSVAIDSNVMIVSAILSSTAGQAYVFRYNGALWLQEQILNPTAPFASGDLFGIEVDIYGDYAIVGAQYNDAAANNAGSAYIYYFNGTSWIAQQRLNNTDAAASDFFGKAVALENTTAIIGAFYDDPRGLNSGSAYVFDFDGTSWNQSQKLVPADGNFSDFFGYSVDIEYPWIVVGAFQDNVPGWAEGSVYMFLHDGTSWSQQQKLTAFDGFDFDNFSRSVDLDGDALIVSSYFDDDNGSNSGSVYFFRNIVGTWGHWKKVIPCDGNQDEVFGCAVAMHDSTVIIGSYLDNQNGMSTGSAYLYQYHEDIFDLGANIDTCANVPIPLVAYGAVSYLWSTGDTTASLVASPTTPTIYSITATYSNGCVVIDTITISINSSMDVLSNVANESCSPGDDGSITLTFSGATNPIIFSWSTGSTDQDIFNLTSGNYSVSVSDSVGCYTVLNETVGLGILSGIPGLWTWTGEIDSNWFKPCNWDKMSAPTAVSPVLIPGGTLNPPIISADTAWCDTIRIDVGNAGELFIDVSGGGVLGD